MKKFLKIMLIMTVLAGISTISTQAISNTEKDRGYVALSTSANMEVSPDIAEISFAVKTSDTKSMQKATLMNKEISDKVLSQIKGLINTNDGDYIKTSNFNASPIYTYSGNKKNLDKYEVSNRVIVHTKNIEKVGAMIDRAIEAGATNVDSLNFSLSNYESQCNSLIETATKKAHTRASIAVKSAGTMLDGIRSMDISCSESANHVMPRLYMAKNMLAATADSAASGTSSTEISGGTIKVYANVNISYFVK